MIEASLSARVEASAERVWSLLSGPDLQKVIIATYAKRSEFEDTPDGPVLRTVLLDDSVVREKIERLDNERRCLEYRVLEGGSFPYRNYRGRMQIDELDADACRLVFECRFEPVEASAEDSRRVWRAHNEKVLESIKQFLGVA